MTIRTRETIVGNINELREQEFQLYKELENVYRLRLDDLFEQYPIEKIIVPIRDDGWLADWSIDCGGAYCTWKSELSGYEKQQVCGRCQEMLESFDVGYFYEYLYAEKGFVCEVEITPDT